jgi:hypothetical protein
MSDRQSVSGWDEDSSRTFLDYGRYFAPERERQIGVIGDLVSPPPTDVPGGALLVELCSGEPDLPEYPAEPGDSASLVIERGLLAWPTPFEIDFVGMGGTATTWERHVYYRLSWVKASGARLSMAWAGEQPYDGVNLWRALGSFLVNVDIH